jgi:hypothetical protein
MGASSSIVRTVVTERIIKKRIGMKLPNNASYMSKINQIPNPLRDRGTVLASVSSLAEASSEGVTKL